MLFAATYAGLPSLVSIPYAATGITSDVPVFKHVWERSRINTGHTHTDKTTHTTNKRDFGEM
jgi:hypothetical protein